MICRLERQFFILNHIVNVLTSKVMAPGTGSGGFRYDEGLRMKGIEERRDLLRRFFLGRGQDQQRGTEIGEC